MAFAVADGGVIDAVSQAVSTLPKAFAFVDRVNFVADGLGEPDAGHRLLDRALQPDDPGPSIFSIEVRFCEKNARRVMIYDSGDYPMPGVAPMIRPIVAPYVLQSALKRLSKHRRTSTASRCRRDAPCGRPHTDRRRALS